MNETKYDVIIGQVGPTFGRKGEVKVRPFTDHLEQFAAGIDVCLSGLPEGDRILKIEKAWDQTGLLIVKFVGVDDMSSAEAIRHAEVRISTEDLVPLNEDEYYIDDLIGMDVVTSEGEDWGKIIEILESPANDLYVTNLAMIPAVKEFVLKIDLQKRKIVVRAMEGLLLDKKNEG